MSLGFRLAAALVAFILIYNAERSSAQFITNDQVHCRGRVFCPAGTECCGNVCCRSNVAYCSRLGCIPIGSKECGDTYCQPGQKCTLSGECLSQGAVNCGRYFCKQGEKCGRGWRACLARGDVDCGSKAKETCPAGKICWVAPLDVGVLKEGKLYCPDPSQLAKIKAEIRAITAKKQRLKE
jgi:hypothetical protein